MAFWTSGVSFSPKKLRKWWTPQPNLFSVIVKNRDKIVTELQHFAP